MKIKRLLQDPAGTFVQFADGARYDFKPDSPLGPYVAEVDNDEHAARLLSLSYAYEEVPDEGATPEPVAPSTEPPAPPVNEPVGEGDAPSEGTGDASDVSAPADQDEAAASQAISLEDMSDEALRDHYLQTVGKKPHHNAGRDKLIQHINAALSAE